MQTTKTTRSIGKEEATEATAVKQQHHRRSRRRQQRRCHGFRRRRHILEAKVESKVQYQFGLRRVLHPQVAFARVQIKVVTLVIVAPFWKLSSSVICSHHLLRLVLCATTIVIGIYQVVNHGALKVGFADRLIRQKNLWILDSCETETNYKKSPRKTTTVAYRFLLRWTILWINCRCPRLVNIQDITSYLFSLFTIYHYLFFVRVSFLEIYLTPAAKIDKRSGEKKEEHNSFSSFWMCAGKTHKMLLVKNNKKVSRSLASISVVKLLYERKAAVAHSSLRNVWCLS